MPVRVPENVKDAVRNLSLAGERGKIAEEVLSSPEFLDVLANIARYRGALGEQRRRELIRALRPYAAAVAGSAGLSLRPETLPYGGLTPQQREEAKREIYKLWQDAIKYQQDAELRRYETEAEAYKEQLRYNQAGLDLVKALIDQAANVATTSGRIQADYDKALVEARTEAERIGKDLVDAYGAFSSSRVMDAMNALRAHIDARKEGDFAVDANAQAMILDTLTQAPNGMNENERVAFFVQANDAIKDMMHRENIFPKEGEVDGVPLFLKHFGKSAESVGLQPGAGYTPPEAEFTKEATLIQPSTDQVLDSYRRTSQQNVARVNKLAEIEDVLQKLDPLLTKGHGVSFGSVIRDFMRGIDALRESGIVLQTERGLGSDEGAGKEGVPRTEEEKRRLNPYSWLSDHYRRWLDKLESPEGPATARDMRAELALKPSFQEAAIDYRGSLDEVGLRGPRTEQGVLRQFLRAERRMEQGRSAHTNQRVFDPSVAEGRQALTARLAAERRVGMMAQREGAGITPAGTLARGEPKQTPTPEGSHVTIPGATQERRTPEAELKEETPIGVRQGVPAREEEKSSDPLARMRAESRRRYAEILELDPGEKAKRLYEKLRRSNV